MHQTSWGVGHVCIAPTSVTKTGATLVHHIFIGMEPKSFVIRSSTNFISVCPISRITINASINHTPVYIRLRLMTSRISLLKKNVGSIARSRKKSHIRSRRQSWGKELGEIRRKPIWRSAETSLESLMKVLGKGIYNATI